MIYNINKNNVISNLDELPSWLNIYGPWFFLPADCQKKWFEFANSDDVPRYTVSQLLDGKKIVKNKSLIFIKDDLPAEEFRKNLIKLVNLVYLPLFHLHMPVVWSSKHMNIGKKDLTFPDPAFIHGNLAEFQEKLSLEQLNFLIAGRRAKIEFSDEGLQFFPPAWILSHAKSLKLHIEMDDAGWYYLSGQRRRLKCIPANRWPEQVEESTCSEWGPETPHKGIQNQKILSLKLVNLLDSSQYAAVTSPPENAQILAPAGSGKTRTLIYRIVYLIQKGIQPGAILALAFNRKAMIEMQERLAQLGISGVQVYTLHAFGFKILRHFLPRWKFSSDDDSQKTMREFVAEAIEIHYKPKTFRHQELISEVLEAVETVKNTLADPESIVIRFEEDVIELGKIFPAILDLQKKHTYFGFSDMIYLAVRLLLKQSEFRHKMQQQFRAVLVDEFQDLNTTQMLMIDILTRPYRHFFAVGDDDQLIYSWRGAKADYLLNFESYYGSSHRYILDYNYRCPLDIVLLSKQLISNNSKRFEKNIYAANSNYIPSVDYITATDAWEEANHVVAHIEKELQEGVKPNEIAVLSRFHAFLFLISLQLQKKNIPHYLPDPALLFHSAAGKDFLAYLYCAVNPEKAAPWMVQRVLKRPNKFLTNKFIYSIKNLKQVEERAYREFAPWQWEKLAVFLDSFNYLHHLKKGGMSAFGFIKEMVRVFELEFLYSTDKESGMEVEQAGEKAILEILTLMSKNFEKPEQFLDYLVELSTAQKMRKKSKHEILLTTIHRTKGNEYPYVFLFHMNNNVDENTEDERRVYYVGLTRAKKRLYVSYIYGQEHRFVKEMIGIKSEKTKADSRGELNKIRLTLNMGHDAFNKMCDKARLHIESPLHSKKIESLWKSVNNDHSELEEEKLHILIPTFNAFYYFQNQRLKK